MIWALVALIVLLAGLAVGAASYVLWSRRRLLRRKDVFPCRLRPAGPLEKPGWSRTRRHAYWVNDVLLVHRGPSLTRCEALAVRNVAGPAVAMKIDGLGPRAVWLHLQLDDGRFLDLAARNGDVNNAIGPFVVASMRMR